MEARMQAELLYALRAITRYMTWSAFAVFIVVILLSLLLLFVGHFKKENKNQRGKFNKKMCGRALSWEGACWILRRGSEQMEIKEKLSKESHLKLQVDTQTVHAAFSVVADQ